MFPTIDMAAIQALPPADRVALAHAILDTVTDEEEAGELTAAQKAELDRRVAHARANPDDFIPVETVMAEAMARLRR